MSIWSGIFAPKGTPKEVVRKLSVALDKALDDPSVIKRSDRSRRLDPGEGRAQSGQVRENGEGGNVALEANPGSGGTAGGKSN